MNFPFVIIGLFCLAFGASSFAQASPQKIDGLYVNTFGDDSHPSLIFVHGGPGYHSWDFELTTAPVLAQAGYKVIVYDQRGQGRSDVTDTSVFNYQQYADDLALIIRTLDIKDPVLLGHSHGGPISIKFDQLYPGVAKKIVLVAAPINFWGSLRSLLDNCARYHQQKGDQQKVRELAYIYYGIFIGADLSADDLPGYVSAAFSYALGCGLYATSNPTPDETLLRTLLRDNPVQGPLSGQMTAVGGFLKNDHYIKFDGVDHVALNREHFCGIYGEEDGLFTPLELALIQNALQRPNDPTRFISIPGASHSIYIDQQADFIAALRGTCGVGPDLGPVTPN